jgi:glycosyltransferase involved in cell wall biosynthesis
MSRKRVLYVLHNHPVTRPGGAEAYALELYEAMRESPEFEPVLVARVGPHQHVQNLARPGTLFSRVDTEDPDQYFVYTDAGGYDWFLGTFPDKSLYTMYWKHLLQSFRPEVVHFQHTHFIGYDLITLTRRLLPDVPIVYTLHEYIPICHRDGQMVRTIGEKLCTEASPRRCNQCFPDWSPQHFFLRERLIKSHLSHVDEFLAPSKFLLERYVDWGIPRDKIRFEDYGRLPETPVPQPPGERPRNRLGFFGQVSPYKGAEILLAAMRILKDTLPDVHLWLYGANMDVLPPDARESLVQAMQTAAEDGNVTLAGAYDHAAVPRLMAAVDWIVVPSRWWENSPLVIQEAFMHKRPVICSDIGGMKEKVTREVNGLHFIVSNPQNLADTIARAVTTPGLWAKLQAGIPDVFSMEEHMSNLAQLYNELIERRSPQMPQPELIPTAG